MLSKRVCPRTARATCNLVDLVSLRRFQPPASQPHNKTSDFHVLNGLEEHAGGKIFSDAVKIQTESWLKMVGRKTSTAHGNKRKKQLDLRDVSK